MGKRLAEAPITTRNARASLAAGVHWRGIDPEVHLGYRKAKRGGVWLVRWRAGKGYRQETIGTADDIVREGTLDFEAACRAARDHIEVARVAAKAEAEGPAPTVRVAAEAYIQRHEARIRARTGGKLSRKAARGQLGRHVLPDEIADKLLHELTRSDLKAWRKRVTDKGLVVDTVRRVSSDLRAALNMAVELHHARLPAALPLEIKHGLAAAEGHSPVAREAQVLPDADVRRIIAAAWEVDAAEQKWEGDLARLIVVLAATGARFSQVIRLTVGDVQAVQRRLMVPTSFKGRGVKVGKIGVPVGDDVIDALRPAVAGRIGSEPLLVRWRYKQTTPTHWERVGRGPWGTSAEFAPAWKLITARAGLPAGVVPYALRHSSIVRGLRQLLPVRLVAALHDTSSAMIEAHYSAFIVSALDELAAKAVVPLVSAPAEIVAIPRPRAVGGAE